MSRNARKGDGSEPRRWYVVWVGRKPGVYSKWPHAREQVVDFKGAKYKSFDSEKSAKKAFSNPWTKHINVHKRKSKKLEPLEGTIRAPEVSAGNVVNVTPAQDWRKAPSDWEEFLKSLDEED